jgi:hypothetical protein
MKKFKLSVSASVAAAVILLMAVFAVLKVDAVKELLKFGNDPDIPSFASVKNELTKEEFLLRREEQIAMYRGMMDGDVIENISARSEAVETIEKQEETLMAEAAAAPLEEQAALLAAWTPLGPAPIPNGQTEVNRVSVSGRVTAVAIHPTNSDIVYVGTSQGGLYRTTDGGTNWIPLMDNAQSLAIGAIAIAPSNPEIVYVGTGEPHFTGASFFGVGVYRIENASTTATLNGPLGFSQLNGRAIGEVVVHPTDPATIFVGTTSGLGGFRSSATLPSPPNRGIYRSTNATTSATFDKLALPLASQDTNIRDLAIDPLNPNLLVAWVTSSPGGILVTNNALAPAPTFTQPLTVTGTTSDTNGELSIYHVSGQPNPVIYAATGSAGGTIHRSIDGGASFQLRIDNNFCGGQCFFNIAVKAVPTNTNPDNDSVYIGGQTNPIFAYSTNGAASFTTSQVNLHGDTNAIDVAASNPAIIYHGNDGGIWKSTNSGANWTTLNNSQFLATQFNSLDTHPTDPTFSIGGTQDNGTNFLNGAGVWSHAADGDGGQVVVDQNASNTTAVTMYHTYFNQTNAMGYDVVLTSASANPNGWALYGCGFGGAIPNGMTCSASAILFYAPMERGPGNPNTLYFGSDVLYRSANSGVTMTKVSQEPIQSGVAISTIGISPQNDNVRIVGMSNGGIWGTGTSPGTTTLQNLDSANAVPNNFVSRVIIDPTNQNTAYVTLSVFNTPQIYKTTNLNNSPPTWTAISGAATGLPLVPVTALLVENNVLYAGTDIGVYISTNGGSTWAPFGFGLPRVAVFDMAFAGSGAGRMLRIATYGKGLYQIPAAVPQAILSISGTVTYGTNASINVANASLSAVSSIGEPTVNAASNSAGGYTLNNLFTNGQYTVTPTKTGDRNGISPFDATLVLRHIAANGQGPNALNANQRIAADSSGDGNISPFDATLILRYIAAGAPNANTGQVGNWKFDPVSRPYQPLNNSVSGHNYTAFLIGEINGS